MMDLRPFDLQDADAVVALWQQCGLTRPWNDPYRDIARKLQVQSDLFLVAIADERVVGTVMAGYEGHRGWVNYLAVDAAHRRRGIGRMLMERIEHELLEAGCPKVNLQVRRANDAVIAFYRAIGYSVDKVVSMGKRLIPDDETA